MIADIHFMLATTLSMIITLIFYISLEGTRVNDNLFQNIFIDKIRDGLFLIRCPFDNGEVNDTCIYRYHDLFCIEYFIWYYIAFLNLILKWRYGDVGIKYLMFVFDLLKNAWLIARLCNGLNLSSKADVFTIYFLVWQFMHVSSQWISHELPWFSFNVQRGLLCLQMAHSTLIVHDVYCRYFPISVKVAFLWFLAIEDCFTCLYNPTHQLDKLSGLRLSRPPGCSIFSGQYYMLKDYEDMELIELKKLTRLEFLGLGDFFCYNLMILFILPPLSSIEMKICIGVGCIIFIQIGYIVTMWTGIFSNETLNKPAASLPVVAFSVYIFLLDIFTEDFNSNLC